MSDYMKINPLKRELIVEEDSEVKNYKPDQTVICTERYFQHVYGTDYKIMTPDPTMYDLKWMPYIMYPSVERNERKKRLKVIQCRDFEVDENIPSYPSSNLCSEREAEERYLTSKPTYFLILSKPDIGEVQLGNYLSEYWKCVNINPKKLIDDEIDKGSRAGKCIEFNLKHGKAIESEVLLRLAERCVESDSVKHRGCVISGFPMVPNDQFTLEPLSTESAIFTAEEILEEIYPLDVESSEDIKGSVVSNATEITSFSSKSSLSNVIKRTTDFRDTLTTIEEQMNFLIRLFQGKSLVIVYLSSSNPDVVSKRKSYRYNVETKSMTSVRKDLLLQERMTFNLNPVEDTYHEGNVLKKLARLPIHFDDAIYSQLAVFERNLIKLIEQQVLNLDPQKYIKLDGRLSPAKMFHVLRTRIITLGLQPVILPKNLLEDKVEIMNEAGEVPEEKLTMQSLIRRNIIGPMYKWRLSHFKEKCPVSYSKGLIVRGSYEHPVSFMDKIYLFHNDTCMKKFCENPRQYLFPMEPEVPCKIWIMGPKHCGKTAIAQCLSYALKIKLLNPKVLKQEYCHKKMMEFIENVRMTAVAEALEHLNKRREESWERYLNDWKETGFTLLERAYSILNAKNESSLALIKFEEDIYFELEGMNLPITLEEIDDLLKDPNKMDMYAPHNMFSSHSATIFDPFVTDYVRQRVEGIDMPSFEDLTEDEIVDMFMNAFRTYENTGWIVDGMPADLSLISRLSQFMPNDVICLVDSDPGDVFLQAKYARREFIPFSDYQEFFLNLRRTSIDDALRKSLKQVSPHKFVEQIIKDRKETTPMSTIDEDIDFLKVHADPEYAEHLSDFRNRWKQIKPYLEDMCPNEPIDLNIAYKNIRQVMREALILLDNQYKLLAKPFTSHEKAEDFRDFGGDVLQEESAGESGNNLGKIIYSQNRRLGQTNDYCPVTFYKHFVLWKGKEEFAATYNDKIYLMSSKDNLNLFLTKPNEYLSKRIKKLPPPRICITGYVGSGKTLLSKKISLNLGLRYVNFDALVLKYYGVKEDIDLHDLLTLGRDNNELMKTRPEVVELLSKYLKESLALPEKIYYRILHPLWFKYPYKNYGFVLDGFPRTEKDVEFMAKNFFIPDIVIKLDIPMNQSLSRVLPEKMRFWGDELEHSKNLREQEYRLEYENWRILRSERTAQMIFALEELRKKGSSIMAKTKLFPTPTSSKLTLQEDMQEEPSEFFNEDIEEDYFFVFHPGIEEDDLEAISTTLDEELPPPKMQTVWEAPEEAQERITKNIEVLHAQDAKQLDKLKHILQREQIEFFEINATKSEDKIFYHVSQVIDKLKFRNFSIFERVYDVSTNDAERLLERGYYLLSTFGRTCPVQIYENKIPLQLYLHAETTATLYPVIHRKYIYFIVGDENLMKFKDDPLKYIDNGNWMPNVPLKIAIIGPPNSGKSTLAERFAQEYGLKVITPGKALQYAIKNLEFSDMTKKIRKLLKTGLAVTPELLAKAIETLTFDARSVCQGYILDGIPCELHLMKHLADLGVIPYMFFVMKLDTYRQGDDTVNSKSAKYKQPYSLAMIKRQSDLWDENFKVFGKWVQDEFQNLYYLEPVSKWETWTDANEIATKILSNMVYFLRHRHYDLVFCLKYFCVTRDEFYCKMSNLKSCCPCCIQLDESIVDGNNKHFDREGIHLFRDFYYWICKKHSMIFRRCPEMSLPPYAKMSKMPVVFPHVFTKADCVYTAYNDGVCIVCFWDMQPVYSVVPGIAQYTVNYMGNNYMFCCKICMAKFVKNPQTYFDKKVHYKDMKPVTFDVNNLPTLGYLEQYVAEVLTKIVAYTEKLRPLLPGFDLTQSAAIFIGLHLKLSNAKNESEKNVYKRAMEIFEKKRQKVSKSITILQTCVNPFISLDC